MDTGVYRRWVGEKKINKEEAANSVNKEGAVNSTGLRKHYLLVRYMKSTCKSLLEGSFYVRIDQALFTPIDADSVKRALLSVLYRDLTLFASRSAALFSSSNLPPAENVIALLSLVTFSLFQHMTKLLHSVFCAAHGYFQQIPPAIER